uniref:Uncharacterized protein n=1 Tax=Rhizophora mucronata TaxID=61149 RepID=A0A2P2Q909_RHIMU
MVLDAYDPSKSILLLACTLNVHLQYQSLNFLGIFCTILYLGSHQHQQQQRT